ncbi:proline-rich receptor-like protein kinase PERK2 isoform X1 [Malus sylvestris]|uniref:proline-rich receptor-like protein kinase PERK2 isoform X1 n=1 Tax=Malus sylvestris TaxID=3752 RepID=UPI0021AC6A3C|nr:proline-rich receptor-like protein kinase PERK2 isoform X1 [Malus sylvestris]
MCYVGKATKIFIFVVTVLVVLGLVLGFGVLRHGFQKSHKCSADSYSCRPLSSPPIQFPNPNSGSNQPIPPNSDPTLTQPSPPNPNFNPPPPPNPDLTPSPPTSISTPPPPTPPTSILSPPPPTSILSLPPPSPTSNPPSFPPPLPATTAAPPFSPPSEAQGTPSPARVRLQSHSTSSNLAQFVIYFGKQPFLFF